ncbi:hypothetical protein GQ42DRAFT_151885 [Ramicandelaber brevisporus]|nr:hypothetical protein GQ42DRAFT_151885 [Ramicandelaber brevisporus]
MTMSSLMCWRTIRIAITCIVIFGLASVWCLPQSGGSGTGDSFPVSPSNSPSDAGPNCASCPSFPSAITCSDGTPADLVPRTCSTCAYYACRGSDSHRAGNADDSSKPNLILPLALGAVGGMLLVFACIYWARKRTSRQRAIQQAQYTRPGEAAEKHFVARHSASDGDLSGPSGQVQASTPHSGAAAPQRPLHPPPMHYRRQQPMSAYVVEQQQHQFGGVAVNGYSPNTFAAFQSHPTAADADDILQHQPHFGRRVQHASQQLSFTSTFGGGRDHSSRGSTNTPSGYNTPAKQFIPPPSFPPPPSQLPQLSQLPHGHLATAPPCFTSDSGVAIESDGDKSRRTASSATATLNESKPSTPSQPLLPHHQHQYQYYEHDLPQFRSDGKKRPTHMALDASSIKPQQSLSIFSKLIEKRPSDVELRILQHHKLDGNDSDHDAGYSGDDETSSSGTVTRLHKPDRPSIPQFSPSIDPEFQQPQQQQQQAFSAVAVAGGGSGRGGKAALLFIDSPLLSPQVHPSCDTVDDDASDAGSNAAQSLMVGHARSMSTSKRPSRVSVYSSVSTRDGHDDGCVSETESTVSHIVDISTVPRIVSTGSGRMSAYARISTLVPSRLGSGTPDAIGAIDEDDEDDANNIIWTPILSS